MSLSTLGLVYVSLAIDINGVLDGVTDIVFIENPHFLSILLPKFHVGKVGIYK